MCVLLLQAVPNFSFSTPADSVLSWIYISSQVANMCLKRCCLLQSPSVPLLYLYGMAASVIVTAGGNSYYCSTRSCVVRTCGGTCICAFSAEGNVANPT